MIGLTAPILLGCAAASLAATIIILCIVASINR